MSNREILELKEQFGLEIPNKEYFENLNACQLVDVNLNTLKDIEAREINFDLKCFS